MVPKSRAEGMGVNVEALFPGDLAEEKGSGPPERNRETQRKNRLNCWILLSTLTGRKTPSRRCRIKRSAWVSVREKRSRLLVTHHRCNSETADLKAREDRGECLVIKNDPRVSSKRSDEVAKHSGKESEPEGPEDVNEGPVSLIV